MSWPCPFRPLPAIPLIALAVCALIACPGGSKGVATAPPGGGSSGSGAIDEIAGDGDEIHLERSHPGDGESEPDQVSAGPGLLTKDVINKAIRARYAEFRTCYENLEQAHPGLTGKLAVRFTIGTDGTVTEASAKGIHPDLESCMEGELRKLKFPRENATGVVQVSYPFTFSR